MRRVLQASVYLTALLVFPCAGGADDQDTRPALLAYVDVWNSGEVDRLRDLVTSDFQRHAGPDESCRSLAELEDLVARTRSVWTNLEITIEDSLATADGGALRGAFKGVHRKTRGIIQFPVMSMFRLVDGKIAEEWIIGNNFLSLVTLGYELVPPGFEIVPADAATADQAPVAPEVSQ